MPNEHTALVDEHPSTTHESYTLASGMVVTPDGVLEDGAIRVEEGKITAVERELDSDPARVIDVSGKVVMPGMIDLHSDALEKFIEPRPRARLSMPVAITEFDKHIASCGITTMYHCVCFMDWQNLRSIRTIENAEKTVREVNRMSPHLNVRNRIHARYDLPTIEAMPVVFRLVQEEQIHLLSLMDHTPGQGQYSDIDKFRKEIRGHMSEDDFDAFIKDKQARRARIDHEEIESLAKLAKEHGVSLASHDDDSVEKVEWAASLGVTVSEFPVSMEATQAAHERGLYTGFGAPNFLRGSSHSGNVSARDALSEGCGDYVCSDYSPMTMLHAVFTLHDLELATLVDLVNMVTLNPAKAVGAADEIGSIEPGKQADLIVVDTNSEVPRVSRVFVGGKQILYTDTH